MKFRTLFAVSMTVTSLIAAPAVLAAEPAKIGGMSGTDKHMAQMSNMHEFMKACDMDHDGMMSKAEMLAHMEKMFDKMDTKKTGKLDSRQTQEFLKQFTAPSGG
jgi:hypothetical protein